MDLEHLITLARQYQTLNKGNDAILPRLSIYSRDVISDIEASIYDPVICLILQGGKVTSTGDHTVHLRPGDALLVSHDLPVLSRITSATPASPYMALILSLDLTLVRGLYDQVAGADLPDAAPTPLAAGPADPTWVAPLVRYLEMMETSLDARVLGPATLREIHYRLLMSPLGGMLRHLLIADSHASRITRAIHSLRAGFRARLSMPDLAQVAGMSPSSFHEHFKSVTGTTPLQYQKDLRLIEARSLMAEQQQSVAEAAFAVGYESTTHFSRDYRRKYGAPPSQTARAAQRLAG